MREVLHFAHGNGFPSPCYRQLLLQLNRRFNYYYIERVGHEPARPVSENWRSLIDEVVESVRVQAAEPVIGLGHSLGGILSLLAAIEHPELFKMVILLDSPLMGRIKSRLLQFSKHLGVIDRVTPALRTRERQQQWQTREQVISYLKSRKLFASFTDDCLNDYIDYGMDKHQEGYTLRFDPEIEYQIYCTIPHEMYENERKLKVPTVLIYGDKSNYVGWITRLYMKKHYGIVNFKTDGTHMFPMEYPKKTADLIFNVIDHCRALPSR